MLLSVRQEEIKIYVNLLKRNVNYLVMKLKQIQKYLVISCCSVSLRNLVKQIWVKMHQNMKWDFAIFAMFIKSTTLRKLPN